MGQSFAFQSIVAKPFKRTQGGTQRRNLWKGFIGKQLTSNASYIVEWKYFRTDGAARNEERNKGV
jgi:hypothetical protein